jgi:S-DNA-T family DNA segregation ATPase FtsK/SpoIIIE
MIRGAIVALLAAVAVGVALAAMVRPAILIGVAIVVVAAPFSKVGRVLLVAVIAAAAVTGALVIWLHPWLFAAAVALLVAWPAVAVCRFIRATPATRRNYPAVIRARIRWRWLARNVGLAPVDYRTRHASRGESAPMGRLARAWLWHRGPEGQGGQVIGRIHYPPARIHPDDFGLVAEVRTVPGVERKQFEEAAPHLANYWRCHRVQVHQAAPGRVVLRGLRRDPLTLPYPMADAPVGVYDGDEKPFHRLRLYVGRDEWGTDRWAQLPHLGGIAVGGLTGYGKTTLTGSWLCQLAALDAVQFVIIDGKGAADYSDWADRAWIYTGDELPAAAAALEDVHAVMRTRFAAGCRNLWRTGPTRQTPLIVTVVDECHTFLDIDAVKSDKEAEKHVRTARAMLGQLVRKGRAALMLSVLLTQKQTSDSIPTSVRDNCGLGICFATKTKEAAVAALGESIRQYESYCPTTLQDSAYVGVATASLRTGADPFVRLRVPFAGEDQAAAVARSTAALRWQPGIRQPVEKRVFATPAAR